MVNNVGLDAAMVGEGKVDAVACIADVVPANQAALAVPLVDSVAAPVRDQRRIAVLRGLADSFFNGLAGRGQSCLAFDAIIQDLRAGNFLQVNSVQGIIDEAVFDSRAVAGDKNGGVVIGKAQSGSGHAQALDRNVSGTDGDHAPVSISANDRAFLARQRQWFIYANRAAVNAGSKSNCFTGPGGIDLLLQRGGVCAEHESKRDGEKLHGCSFRESQPAIKINNTEIHKR